MVYFDNAATSPLLPEVKQFIVDHLDCYGNPSSLYYKGYEAKELLEMARETIAGCIYARPEDIYFTSGSTEANAQAIFSHNLDCAISSMEHPSVEKNLLTNVHKKFYPNINGIISAENVDMNFGNPSKFVSIAHVNSELGVIQPIKEITEVVHKHNSIMHSDMTQSFGHIPVHIKDIGVDMASASGHKFGAPKGIGFLYCNTENNIFPIKVLDGGSQERGYRAGTENVIGAAAMALALKISVDNLEKNMKKVSKMKEYILAALVGISGVRFNGSFADCVPGIINVSFKGLRGDELQSMLDDRNIAVSTGSACHSGVNTPSNTLLSIQVPEEYIGGTIRISLSHMNTMDEAEEFIKNLKEVIEILRRY